MVIEVAPDLSHCQLGTCDRLHRLRCSDPLWMGCRLRVADCDDLQAVPLPPERFRARDAIRNPSLRGGRSIMRLAGSSQARSITTVAPYRDRAHADVARVVAACDHVLVS